MNAKWLCTALATLMCYVCSVPTETFDRVRTVDGLTVRAMCEIPMQGIEQRKVIITGKEFYKERKEHISMTEHIYELESLIDIHAEMQRGSSLEGISIGQMRKFYESAERNDKGWIDTLHK